MNAGAVPVPHTAVSDKGTEGTTDKGTYSAEGGPGRTQVPLSGRVPLDAVALERRWLANADGSFPCPVPGHHGTALLVVLDDELRLGCCSGRWRSLGEVRTAEAYGRNVFQPSNIEIAVWTRRLAYETGTFEPLDVLVPLPAGLTDGALHARNGFALLIGLRWRDGKHRPVAFSIRFAAAWCSMTRTQAHEAVRELLGRGVIHEAGRKGRVRLYLPGESS